MIFHKNSFMIFKFVLQWKKEIRELKAYLHSTIKSDWLSTTKNSVLGSNAHSITCKVLFFSGITIVSWSNREIYLEEKSWINLGKKWAFHYEKQWFKGPLMDHLSLEDHVYQILSSCFLASRKISRPWFFEKFGEREKEFLCTFFRGTRVFSWDILSSPGVSLTLNNNKACKNIFCIIYLFSFWFCSYHSAHKNCTIFNQRLSWLRHIVKNNFFNNMISIH